MRKINFFIVGAFLLFVNTGIQSSNHNTAKPILSIEEHEPSYEIPEFEALHKAIQKQIELNNKLDSLTQH